MDRLYKPGNGRHARARVFVASVPNTRGAVRRASEAALRAERSAVSTRSVS